jgi:hypothetical protein
LPPTISPCIIREMKLTILSIWLAFFGAVPAPAAPATLTVPFDFSRNAIGVDVTLNGTQLYVIFDTGVDPSVIDLARAEALGLKVDRKDGGEASGFGNGKGADVYPTSVAGLTIDGRRFKPFDALASDMTTLSNHYGRKLDAVIGYSFLSDKAILIDYPRQTLSILAKFDEAKPLVRTCRTRWTAPLTTSDSFPIIPSFRVGKTSGSVSLDTGSNGGIGLFPRALALPGVRASMVEKGTVIHSGARGDSKASTYSLTVPVGFGPFTLPTGQVATVHSGESPADGRIANVGNPLFAAMRIKMLLDYRGRTMTFYGDCR